MPTWNGMIKKAVLYYYADEGGVPPGNKTKIQSLDEEAQIKLNSTLVGHFLKDEDQIILGESVVLQFNYLDEKPNDANGRTRS